MKKRYMVELTTLALAGFSTPALADGCMDDVETRAVGFTPTLFTNGTVGDGTVIALEGGSGTATWVFYLPTGSDYYAYAHWHSWGGCPGNPTARFCNGNGVCQTIHITDCVFDDNTSGCWCSGAEPGNGTHHFFWKMNAPAGSNNLTLCGCNGVFDKWFVAVIDNTDPVTHDGYWWHNFGHTNACYTGSPYSTWFYGPIDTSASHTLWPVQSYYDNANVSIYFNNQFYGTITSEGPHTFSLATFHGIDNIQESSCVDITDNSISNNIGRITSCGVNVGEMPLDDDDPEFINIIHNEFDLNSYGIQLVSFECDISGNNIRNSAGCGAEPGYGIFVIANGNRIYNNTIEDSDSYGIKVYNSTGNCIYENTFINNSDGCEHQAWDNSVDCNFWNTTIEVCYFYPIGSSTCHVSRVGNYWGNLGCNDNNNDGICDNLQVELDGGIMGVDYYPLKYPWCNYKGAKCADADCNDNAYDWVPRSWTTSWVLVLCAVRGLEMWTVMTMCARLMVPWPGITS